MQGTSFLPSTVPINAYQANQNVASFNAANFQLVINNINNAIIAASNIGHLSITYTAGLLTQDMINQITSCGYILTDNSVLNVLPQVFNYVISWTQLNSPPSGQPA